MVCAHDCVGNAVCRRAHASTAAVTVVVQVVAMPLAPATVAAVTLAVTAALAVASGHIIAVDLGADSLKVALVKPGMPFQVVNNFQSKRKVCC